MKFTEAQLEKAIIDLLVSEGYRHVHGGSLARANSEVLLKKMRGQAQTIDTLTGSPKQSVNFTWRR